LLGLSKPEEDLSNPDIVRTFKTRRRPFN